MSRSRFFLIVMLLTGAALVTGFRPIYGVLYAFGIGVPFAWAWARLQSAGLRASLEPMDAFPEVGQPLRIKVTIADRITLRRWALGVGVAGGTHEARVTLDVAARHAAWWTVGLEGLPRGMNYVGPVNIATTDPFGLVRLSRETGERKRVLVYPRVVPVSSGLLTGLGMDGESSSSIRRLKGTSAAARVREYASGDALSHIHWPTSARLDRLMTRELDDGGLGEEVWIILDLKGDAQAGSGEESTEEYAVTIASSIANALLETDAPVGLLAHGERLVHVPTGSGAAQRSSILEALALVRANGLSALSELVHQHASLMGPGSHVIVVAPWFGNEQVVGMTELVRLGATVLPVFLDATTFDSVASTGLPYDLVAAYGGQVVARGDDLRFATERALENVARGITGEARVL